MPSDCSINSTSNVGFFTTGYNWMIQIIPALISSLPPT